MKKIKDITDLEFKKKVLKLHDMFSEVSEMTYFAGWDASLEHDVWKYIQDIKTLPISEGTVRDGTPLNEAVDILNQINILSKELNVWVDYEYCYSLKEWKDILDPKSELVQGGMDKFKNPYLEKMPLSQKMMIPKERSKIDDGPNLMHHLFLWIENWEENHFKVAFKESHLGWRYQWDKFQGNLRQTENSSSALLNTVLNMDNKHQRMLFNFITNNYSKEMKSRQKNIEFMENFKPNNQSE